MTNEDNSTPPSGSLPPITTSIFTTRTNMETPPNSQHPLVDLAFVSANFETLEPLRRVKMRQLRLPGKGTELHYSSEETDEELEMESSPRPREQGTSSQYQQRTNTTSTPMVTVLEPSGIIPSSVTRPRQTSNLPNTSTQDFPPGFMPNGAGSGASFVPYLATTTASHW